MDTGVERHLYANVSIDFINYCRIISMILIVNCLFITAIYCPTLDDIKYGGVSLDDKDRKADSKAHYYCNKGYKLVGDPWRKCQYDGYWGGKEPVCKRRLSLNTY